MNENDIINAARQKAKLSPLPDSDLAEDKVFYDLYLEDLLEEREWLFTIKKETEFNQVVPEIDLGYKYSYVLRSTDVIDVLSINDQHISDIGSVVGYRRAIRYGIATDPAGEIAPSSLGQFVYVNGVLHSDVPITCAYYKRKVTPTAMRASFRLLLILTLAQHFAVYKKKDDMIVSGIKSEKREQHRRAMRYEIKRPKNPELAEIYDFLKSYRTQTSLRYE